jgi:predicted deacylase
MEGRGQTMSTLIWTDIDYDRNGKQLGWLNLPRSAYGMIRIPISVVKNGSGPTILLMAGNHGDEYEGQIGLARFIREVDPAEVQGRIIVLPAANLPAAVAGTRVSPIDAGNLNRAFPGDPEGGPTAAIAHYIDSVIYPLTDAMHDFHSGGSSLLYLPFASMRLSGDEDLDRRALAALKAFAPPYAHVWAHTHDKRLSAAAANTRKIVGLGGEFGGGGGVSIPGVRLVEAGLRRFLHHFAVMELAKDAPPPPDSRFIEVRGRDYYVYADERGVFEPLLELGDEVEGGQLAGYIHSPENPGRPPVPCHFKRDGLVVCRRAMGRTEIGDCLYHLASDWAGPTDAVRGERVVAGSPVDG